jgi:hypothetical protein
MSSQALESAVPVPVKTVEDLSRSLKIKDILYQSKRFRNAQFGENVSDAPPGLTVHAVAFEEVGADSPFYMYPKLRGPINRPAQALEFRNLLRKLPRVLQETVILYV